MEDITPTYTALPAEKEITLPPLVSDTTSQPIGGFNASPSSFSQGNVTLNSVGEQILIGTATAPLTGAGVFIGRDTDGTYDFRAGDPSGNYIHWDASAATLTIKGSISAITQYTAGENVTKGTLGCLLNTVATWGNQANSTTNKSTTAILSAFTYVDQVNPNTAEGAGPNTVKLGTATSTQWIYGKLDLTSSDPGVAAWNEMETVKLRIYVTNAASGSTSNVTLSRLTASFTESTITWNNKPADDGVTWASATVATPTSNGEPCASTADTKNTGYIEFDITDLYRLWSSGTLTNNGFVIKGGSSSTDASIGGRTRTDASAFNEAPFLVFVITKDNPGSGTSFVASDGKVYIAKHSDYQRVKSIVGIIGATVASGASVAVYGLADRSVIPSTVLSVVTGRTYYLSDDSGTLAPLTNDIVESNFYDRRIGIGTASGLMIDLEKSPLFIRSANSQSTGLLPPPNARFAVIPWTYTPAALTFSGTLRLEKGFFTTDTSSFLVPPANVVNTVTASWASGTTGTIGVSGATSATINWYS